MAEKGSKKKGRSKAEEPGVLGGLPATRPSRLGRRGRDGAEDGAESKGTAAAPRRRSATATAAKAKAPASRAKASAKAKAPAASAKAKAPAASAKAKAPAASAKAKAPAATRAKAAAKPKAPKAPAATAKAKTPAAPKPPAPAAPADGGTRQPTVTPISQGERPRPAAVRVASPSLQRQADRASEHRSPDAAGQSGTDLVKTVVQAAGELAQIGATVGGQIIKRAVGRLPNRS